MQDFRANLPFPPDLRHLAISKCLLILDRVLQQLHLSIHLLDLLSGSIGNPFSLTEMNNFLRSNQVCVPGTHSRDGR